MLNFCGCGPPQHVLPYSSFCNSSLSSPFLPQGAVDKIVLPEGMQSVNFYECTGLAGDIAQMNLPVGMQSVNFRQCRGLTGAVDKLALPEGMQIVDFSWCSGLTGKLPATERAKVKDYHGP